MAALTEKAAPLGATTTLESRTITNTSTVTHSGIIQVPARAKSASFFLNLASAAGTSPTLDLDIHSVNPATKDDGDLSEISSMTQLTAAGQGHVIVSALPYPYIAYTVALDGTTGDEDYTYQLYLTWGENV